MDYMASGYLPKPDISNAVGLLGNLNCLSSWVSWTPSVINPAETGGPVETSQFVFHLSVWVLTLILTSIANFGVSGGTFKDETDPANAVDFSDGTKTIGLLSGLCIICGVLGIVVSGALFPVEQYKTYTILHTVITFFLNYSLAGSFFIFARAAGIKEDGGLYTISMLGVIVHTYSVMLFYSCSYALDRLALPKSFLPTLAVSVQFINYLQIDDGSFHCRSLAPASDAVANPSQISVSGKCSDSQRFLALLIPVFTLVGVVVMVAGRRWLPDDDKGQIKNAPFTRSIILTLFLGSGILSIYKYTFLAANVTDNVAGMFGMFGLLLQFGIIAAVFMPPSKQPSQPSQPEEDLERTTNFANMRAGRGGGTEEGQSEAVGV